MEPVGCNAGARCPAGCVLRLRVVVVVVVVAVIAGPDRASREVDSGRRFVVVVVFFVELP